MVSPGGEYSSKLAIAYTWHALSTPTSLHMPFLQLVLPLNSKFKLHHTSRSLVQPCMQLMFSLGVIAEWASDYYTHTFYLSFAKLGHFFCSFYVHIPSYYVKSVWNVVIGCLAIWCNYWSDFGLWAQVLDAKQTIPSPIREGVAMPD